MSSESFIRRYQMPDSNLCEEIIKWFEANTSLHTEGMIMNSSGKPEVNPKVKEGTQITLSINEANNIPVLKNCFDWVWKCVNSYIEEFREVYNCAFAMTQGFNIQKFSPKQGFKNFHFESSQKECSHRLFVFMIYLNSVNNKGGTEFKYYNHTEKAQRGKLLIWPAGYTHTHRSEVSPSETKYIITGWYNLISI